MPSDSKFKKYFIKPKPIVMDEEILKEAIVEQTTQDKAGNVVQAEGIHFEEILQLLLENRNIGKIDHLWDFTSLTRLDLNTNVIEKIEGLDRLVNLTWLNLSFNHIEKIEGLESLRKLEVLNLSKNNISVIENMDTLEKLTNFLFAKNLLGQLDNVLYLRKFKNLFSINLSGNPVSEEEDYKYFIAAYFPNLMCLDYRLIDENTKKEAAIKYQYVLEELRHKELQQKQAEEAEQRRKAELKLHTDAFVEFLNGPQLFQSMIEDDPEAETLQCVPELAHLRQAFEQQIVEQCVQLFETGLSEHKRRETEVKSFFTGHSQAVTGYQQHAAHILAQSEQQHKERIAELQQLSDTDQLKATIDHCNEETSKLCASLMELEFQLVSQLEDIIKKLDISISEMVGNFIETAKGIFEQCQDLEDDYHEKVRQICVATLEKVAQEKLDWHMTDEVQMLFEDKDTVMDALDTSHDNHLLRINERETQLVSRADAWKVALLKEIEDNELKRNRTRISDIQRYVDHLREQLEEFL
ncbi:dynein regulatory complex subunit 3 [Centropristis striata]|uniref:dynein regulatory complex subunit 3 n=1 Tax=Centropristis striata TaxID=184440 RepID=UPI0027E034A8|nr:dynein regulatory complex subunit 3 [Centropristis striata]XP_059204383.1 dynein regulatory complex subunit 3 [Centropristis striata]